MDQQYSDGDFAHGIDRMGLRSTVFTSLAGGLAAGNLALGAAAVDANDFLIYNSATGQVFYDADGSGAVNTQTLITTVTPATVIDIGDFVLA